MVGGLLRGGSVNNPLMDVCLPLSLPLARPRPSVEWTFTVYSLFNFVNRCLLYFHVPRRSPRADPSEVMPWEASASSSAGRLLSFLTCYHFDYHWEHHRWPYAPWWQLPLCKQLRASTAPHSKAAAAAAAAHQQPGGWKTTASQAG